MRRREFLAGLGSAASWPLVARARQPEQMRRIGILLPAAADDAVFQTRVGAFLQGLALLGQTIGDGGDGQSAIFSEESIIFLPMAFV
jgi:putative tryptophan/tyrosine transport system substrate-binding protein